MSQSKEQQIQFFRYCLLPVYEADTSQIDLRAEIDSTLTTEENWALLNERYSIRNERNHRDYEEKAYRHLARKVRENTGLDVDYRELEEMDEDLLEQSSGDWNELEHRLASD